MYILICIFIFLCIYIYGYYKYPANVSILQTSLREFSSSMLLEKQPLILEDKTIDISKIKNTLFKYNYTQSFHLKQSEIWNYNRYKYCIIQFENDGEIYLIQPGTKIENNIPLENEKLLGIQGKQGQILILPLHWHYMILDTSVNCIGTHDMITYFLP